MAILTRAQLKALWISLFKPFETNYDDVWDSFIAPEDNPALDGMTDAFNFGGQAHGGSYVKDFSASATFDADDGNNQYMEVTASTTVGLSNELPGTYILKLEINSGASPVITPHASLGDPFDNNATLLDANGDTNTITVVVDANGDKEYTINTRTA